MEPFHRIATKKLHKAATSRAWKLVRRQHGVVTRQQLLELGMHPSLIDRRLAAGRLHRVWRGVYAVGRPQLSKEGRWIAAVLACGPSAVLSHVSAAALWRLRTERASDPAHVSVLASVRIGRPGIRIHRPAHLAARDITSRNRVPVTRPARTLIDLGSMLGPAQLEAAISRAGKEGLVSPEQLESTLLRCSSLRGAGAVRRILDRYDFVLTANALERAFVPLATRAGLPPPLTGREVNGFEVDFFWPELGLVVETDGLQWHRTPGQQVKDRQRDQAHTSSGLTPLRFTHWQVAHEPDYVVETLRAVAARLGAVDGAFSSNSDENSPEGPARPGSPPPRRRVSRVR
mgnify:CR=1 FL=1